MKKRLLMSTIATAAFAAVSATIEDGAGQIDEDQAVALRRIVAMDYIVQITGSEIADSVETVLNAAASELGLWNGLINVSTLMDQNEGLSPVGMLDVIQEEDYLTLVASEDGRRVIEDSYAEVLNTFTNLFGDSAGNFMVMVNGFVSAGRTAFGHFDTKAKAWIDAQLSSVEQIGTASGADTQAGAQMAEAAVA